MTRVAVLQRFDAVLVWTTGWGCERWESLPGTGPGHAAELWKLFFQSLLFKPTEPVRDFRDW